MMPEGRPGADSGPAGPLRGRRGRCGAGGAAAGRRGRWEAARPLGGGAQAASGVTGIGVNDDHGVDQSITPWSPGAGGRGLPTTSTMSPTRLNP